MHSQVLSCLKAIVRELQILTDHYAVKSEFCGLRDLRRGDVRSFFFSSYFTVFLPTVMLQYFAFTQRYLDHSLMLSFAGAGLVLSCGSNAFGQLGVPQISGPCLIPQKIEVRI